MLNQSIAMRNDTTSKPEMMPIKIESSRKSRSSLAGAIFMASAESDHFATLDLDPLAVTGSMSIAVDYVPYSSNRSNSYLVQAAEATRRLRLADHKPDWSGSPYQRSA